MSRLTSIAAFLALGTTPALAQVAGEAPTPDLPGKTNYSLLANEEIVPASARTVMGGSSNSIPWSWTPTHFMSVYRGSELPQSAYPIRCIAFRSNNRADTGATIDIEIWLGVTTKDESTLDTTYANNYDITSKPPVLVLPRQKIKLDDMVLNTDPAFFQYQIPLTTPYIWTATSGENLIFECKVYGNDQGNASFSFFPDNESGTGTTTTRLYSNNDANATVGNVTRNYAPVLKFDKACRVNSATEDYGNGSTNPPVPGNPWITQREFSRSYGDSRGYPRGWVGQAPVDFVITGVQVENEANLAEQTVAIYHLAAKPPAYTATYTPLPADLVFYKADAPANTLLPTGAIPIKKGNWIAVLGVCHPTGTGLTVTSSYSNTPNPFTTNVLGQPMAIERLISQTVLRTNAGLGGISTEGTGTGNMGRVRVHVAGQGAFNPIVPTLTTSARPIIGTTAGLDSKSNIPSAQAGLLLLSTGRLPQIPTPFGDLLVTLPSVLEIVTPGAGGNIPLPLPSSASLVGAKVTWQNFFFDFTGPIYGASNGVEWLIGEQ
ncbi:MAG: hypothetical protein H6832_00930 [Planctomycetes bacterium]|nr:hypothetical protein [Planctomycetota bacterium]MCB9916947.1 hypothetical protein [Planctomycetota bacterium]